MLSSGMLKAGSGVSSNNIIARNDVTNRYNAQNTTQTHGNLHKH